MTHLLIIGGTGVLGNAAAIHFLEKGFHVSVLVRDKEKAANLKMKGASVITGDLTDAAKISGIFNGIDIVLTAAHGMLGKGKNKSVNVDKAGHQHLIDKAKQAGVKQFIYTSTNFASPDHPVDFFRTKYSVEQYLISSGLSYTILRLPAFMEWHAYNLLGKNIVKKGKTTILGAGKNPANFIAIKDVVAAIDIMAMNQHYYNKIIAVAGPQNISRNEIAELFGKALNIQPKTGHVPAGVLKVFSFLLKPFHPGIARIMKLSVHGETADETMNTQDSIQQFGLRPTTIEDFIQAAIKK